MRFCSVLPTLACLVALPAAAAERVHELTLTSIDGEPLPLEQYAGQPLLIVNTASRCGFTPQYDALQALYDSYRDAGLVVIGLPSNDFGGQEPGTAAEIKEFCEVNFSIDFPMTDKVVTKPGAAQHPFFAMVAETEGNNALPSWNFFKYLISPDGEIADVWPSHVNPMSAEVTAAVEAALTAN